MTINLITVAALFCGLGTLAINVHAVQVSNRGSNDEPDLLHMLDFFKGKSDMTLLTTFLKQAESLRTTVKEIFNLCPACRQLYSEAGKTNVGIRILDKVIEGQTPNIKDMYDLATKGVGNMQAAITNARKKNKKFATLVHMMLTGPNNLTASQMEKYLTGVTGKNFKISQGMVAEVDAGNLHSSVNNIDEENLIEIVNVWKTNLPVFVDFYNALLTPPINFQALLGMLKNLDTSSLAMIKTINEGMNNNKYAVVGAKQTFVTDPLVENILSNLQQASQMLKGKTDDELSAETFFMNALVYFMKLTSQVLKKAELDRKISSS